MSNKFLKLKSSDTEARVLIAADSIAAVHEGDEQTTITLKDTGEEINVKEGFQTLVNRLTKDEE